MEIQLPQIIFQVLNVSVVIFVLNKFLVKPIIKVLDQRAEKIEAGMKAAEANLKKQDKVEAEVEERLKEAQGQADEIRQDAKKQAEKEAAIVLKKAKEEAKKALEKEKQAFEEMMKKERQALQKSYAQSVADGVSAVLRNGLSQADQEKIISSQIKQLQQVSF